MRYYSCYDDDEDSVCVQKEIRVLRGVVDHLLPQVGGAHVRTLDLSHGKAISNEMVCILINWVLMFFSFLEGHTRTPLKQVHFKGQLDLDLT